MFGKVLNLPLLNLKLNTSLKDTSKSWVKNTNFLIENGMLESVT